MLPVVIFQLEPCLQTRPIDAIEVVSASILAQQHCSRLTVKAIVQRRGLRVLIPFTTRPGYEVSASCAK